MCDNQQEKCNWFRKYCWAFSNCKVEQIWKISRDLKKICGRKTVLFETRAKLGSCTFYRKIREFWFKISALDCHLGEGGIEIAMRLLVDRARASDLTCGKWLAFLSYLIFFDKGAEENSLLLIQIQLNNTTSKMAYSKETQLNIAFKNAFLNTSL